MMDAEIAQQIRERLIEIDDPNPPGNEPMLESLRNF